MCIHKRAKIAVTFLHVTYSYILPKKTSPLVPRSVPNTVWFNKLANEYDEDSFKSFASMAGAIKSISVGRR